METIKIQISEVEGMTIRIPTEFTARSFSKFYAQMQLIAKSMPNSHLVVADATPERLKIASWPDKEEALALVNVWDTEGKDAAIKWMKDNKDIELDAVEISRLSQLMAGIRSKYKKELVK